MAYAEKIIPSPPGRAKFLSRHWNLLGRSLKQQGLALHNAVVDLDFQNRSESRDAVVQADDDVIAVMSGGASTSTVWAKTNALWALLKAHFGDGTYAHKAVDSTSLGLLVSAAATDQPTCTTRLLEMKAAINGHMITEAPHNDLGKVQLSVIQVPSDDASNLLVCNEIIRHYQRHVYSAFVDTKGKWF